MQVLLEPNKNDAGIFETGIKTMQVNMKEDSARDDRACPSTDGSVADLFRFLEAL